VGLYIPEDDILHSHRSENLKSYIALTGWALYLRCNVSCEARTGFLYPRNGIIHNHRRESLKSYIALTGWALYWRCNVSCEVRTEFLYPRNGILHSHGREKRVLPFKCGIFEDSITTSSQKVTKYSNKQTNKLRGFRIAFKLYGPVGKVSTNFCG
jgi:hypothetical protein